MKYLIIAMLFFLPLGCATIAEQAKMDEYGRTMDAYEAAMRVSDFNAACQYVEPAEMGRKDCLKRYANLKLVSYDVLGIKVTQDKQEVSQTVEAEYYFLNRYVVKKTQYEQSWRYKEDLEKWMLQTGPPHFE